MWSTVYKVYESSCSLSAAPIDAYKTKEMTQILRRYKETTGETEREVF